MKSFILVCFLLLLITYTYASIPFRHQVLDGGNGPENTKIFKSRELRNENIHKLNKTICSHLFRSYSLSPPTAFKYLWSTIVLATNNDGTVGAWDLSTCTQRHYFNLSDFGGNPGDGTSVGGLFTPMDFSRSSITVDPFSRVAAICSLNFGVGSKCWIYDPTYFGPGAPPLLKTIDIDENTASIITASPKFYRDHGKLKLLVGSSSRGEFYALIPSLNPPTFKGGLYQFDVQSGCRDWVAYGTPESDPGYTGTSVITQSFPISRRHKTIAFGTNNNYQVPQFVRDCILTNGDCSNIDDPRNRPDSIIAVDYKTGLIKWSHEYSFDPSNPNGIAPDNWGFECSSSYTGPEPCPPHTGDDQGPLQSPMLVEVRLDGEKTELFIGGTKRGQVFAHIVETGEQLWLTRTGPGTNQAGGHAFGATYDSLEEIVYFSNNNRENLPWTLIDGTNTTGPFITGIDVKTGVILIQKVLPGVCYQGGIILDRMLICTNRNNMNAPGVLFYDLDDDLNLIHSVEACRSGNNPIIVGDKMVLACGYYGSPEVDNSLYVIGMDD